ncbi:hypothetical protein ACFV6B_30045, partial [Streptomyces microflavus]|uniref:hypothetical protein n=1 Tax=Streptomyces microflavus TaxID=1919 RepID=UPI0036530CB3
MRAQFSQGLSVAGVDRFGLGAGMSLGLPFVDVERGRLVLPSGEHELDDSARSGLKDYRLEDIRLSAGGGEVPVVHAFALESLKDGSKQYFDAVGDLVGVEDRLGHVTKLAWKVVNGKHRLESVTGGWGSKLTVAYEGSRVTFTSPKRWGQAKAPVTVVELAQGRVKSVTDPAGEKSAVEWTTAGGDGVVVPAAVVSPAGGRTEFAYREYEPRSGGIVAVSEVVVKDASGRVLIDPVKISLDPDGANGGRNWTGCPQYCEDGSGRLEDSGDGSFTYRVRFSQGNGQEVERTYNALHLTKSEVSRVKHGSQTKEISRTGYSYPGESGEGAPPKVKDAPADYQMPSRVTVRSVDPADPSRTRETAVNTGYDAMGRQTSQTAGGVETTVEYGEHSIPVRTQTKDTKTGARQVVENTLTEDGTAVAKSVKRAAKDGESDLVTVSSEEFEYHAGELAGEVAKTTVTGDRSAPGGDPGAAVTSTRSSVDKGGEGVGRRTDTVTGADGVESVTVSDLASGATLSTRTGDLGETVTEYDVKDRPVKATATDGTVTTTAYETRAGSGGGRASVTSVRDSDGFSTRTVTDELGRQVREESNYEPSGNGGKGRMLPEGQWRQTSAAEFNTSGQQVATVDAGGRETRVEYDAAGRPAKTTAPDGTVTLSSMDDVEGTTTEQTLPAGADTPAVTSSETVDEQGNPVRTETAHGDSTPGSVTEKQYDALGKPLSTDGSTSAFNARHSYTPAGLPETDTLSSKASGTADEAESVYVLDAFGNKTRKTLSKGGESAEGWKSVFDAAGREREVSAPGDAGTTATAYDPANGLVESAVLPDGSVAHQRHDTAGRTTESWTSPKSDPDAKHEHVHTSYDPVTGQVSAVWFDGDEEGSKITFGYHPDGSVKERTDPGGKTSSFTYNDDGQTATVTDHTGAVTAYTYDEASGRMSGAVQTRDGQELGKVSYGYDAAGRLVKTDRGNGATSRYTFNDAGLPTGEKHTKPGGDVIAEHTYTHTPDRKLATDTALVDGKTTTTAHTYDSEGRLVHSLSTEGDQPGEGTLISRTEYTHDLATNLAQMKTTTRTADGVEETTVAGFQHDSASRTTHITLDGERKPQTYDTAGRLTQAADGTRHTYNTSGQLTETTTGDGTTVTHT